MKEARRRIRAQARALRFRRAVCVALAGVWLWCVFALSYQGAAL